MKINLRSLARVVSQKLSIREELVEPIVKSFISEIVNHLKQPDGKVMIKGFGTFYVSKRHSRSVRHPKTGELVHYEEKEVPKMTFSTRVKRSFRKVVDKF